MTFIRVSITRGVKELCEACMVGKQRHSPFPEQAQWRAENALEVVHGDLCGPITPTTPSRNGCFLLLVDNKRQYMWVSMLTMKAQVGAAIREFRAHAEGEARCKLMTLCIDHGGEFISKEFVEYCTANGVRQQLTASYSPQQNNIVERRNTMVVGATWSMPKEKGLPRWF
jgi:hypothetical protein